MESLEKPVILALEFSAINNTFSRFLMHCDFSGNPYHQKKPKDDGGENSRLVEHNDQIRFSYLAIKLGA